MNKYDPPPEMVAAQDHLTHVVNSVMQPQRIFDRYLLLLHRQAGKHLIFFSPLFCVL